MTASRCSDAGARRAGGLAAAGLALALGSTGLPVAAQAPRQDPGERASERVRALQGQADALLAEEGTLLAQLRGLEIERRRRVEEVVQAGGDRAAAESALADAITRSEALRRTAVEERPEIEGRLVRVYKLGRAGFWRLLLDMDDLRSASRAYRTAAALTRIDRDRVAAHQRTLDALAAEQRRLRQQVAAIGEIEARARVARDAAARAVASRAALVTAIDARRDLNAQLTGELQAAQQRLQVSVAQLGRGGASGVALPLKPFQGALPWPARGRLLSRFGPTAGGGAPGVARSGIVIALLEGQSVRAVHEGTVAYADPFAGFGHLVIVQHGDRTYSLYGHLERLSVSKGAHVEALTPLGTSGTDPAGNPSLYFELRVDGRAVDPLQWLIRE